MLEAGEESDSLDTEHDRSGCELGTEARCGTEAGPQVLFVCFGTPAFLHSKGIRIDSAKRTIYIPESKTIKSMVFRGPEREFPLLQPVKI